MELHARGLGAAAPGTGEKETCDSEDQACKAAGGGAAAESGGPRSGGLIGLIDDIEIRSLTRVPDEHALMDAKSWRMRGLVH